MLQICLANGRVIQRLFAGNVRTEDGVRKFVAELKQELADHSQGESLLVEIWHYTDVNIIRRVQVPTEDEERERREV